jgi:hypothetical protein
MQVLGIMLALILIMTAAFFIDDKE